jgi:hypothetical protein
MIKKKYYILPFLMILFGCKETKFENSDFVGKWKSNDGASIVFNTDGSCIISEMDYFIVSSFPTNKNKRLNTTGTWKIINDVESGITGGINKGIKISYQLPDREGKGGITFYISGQGINENTAPWDLFIWKGDPDEMIKYKFIKQK